MNGIARIRRILKQTQAQFAELLNVSRSTVAMWEKGGQEPGYDTVSQLSDMFNLPPDYIMMRGIFLEWDKVITYYSTIEAQFDMRIPLSLRTLSKRLFNTTLCPLDEEEFPFVRWFAFAVKRISFHEEVRNNPDFVEIEFTPEFNALIQVVKEHSEPAPKDEDGFEGRAIQLIQAASGLSAERRALLLAVLEAAVRACQTSPQGSGQTALRSPDVQAAVAPTVPATEHSNS